MKRIIDGVCLIYYLSL